MKIYREIDGKTVEFILTNDEMFTAYLEQEYAFDMQNVRNRYDKTFTDEEVESIATEARRQMDKYDVDWNFAIEEAISDLGLRDKANA